MLTLVFLGKFSDLAPAGLARVSPPPDIRTLSDLKDWVARTVPLLGEAMASTTTRMILNQTVAHDVSAPVRDGDEIAFLPPMSGG